MVMNAAVPQTKESRFYAGLYLRTRNRTRFWGWGQPELNETQSEKLHEAQNQAPNGTQREARKEGEADRPWASLAEWLRQAHSSTFAQNSSVPPESNSAGKAQEAGRALPAQQRAPAASPGEKRKLRFVWDRKFIGFVIR
jgi:hypothetical protein